MDWLVMSLSNIEEAVLIVVGFILFLLFIVWFIVCLGNALLIKKSGRNFFLGFIPIYNDYVLCEISGTSYFWFVLKYGLPIILGIMQTYFSIVFEGLNSLSFFAVIGFNIALAASLSKSFGKGIITTIMLILFAPLAKIILALTGEYQGAKGCNDVIFGNKDVNNDVVNTINNHPEYHFCPKCGNAITEYDRFCNKCGREI